MMRTMMTVASVVALSIGSYATANATASKEQRKDFGYLVLGTIVSVNKSNSVALVKNRKSGRTHAVRVGTVIGKGLLLSAVNKKMITITQRGESYRIRVGSSEEFGRISTRNIAQHEGLQRRDGNVTVSASYKDHLLKNELNKILMQAAAEPAIRNGKIVGFTLWAIEKGSIYEKLGFKNGDTVTSINDNSLVDAGQAVKVLVSLKRAKNLALKYTRGGVEHQMQVRVQ